MATMQTAPVLPSAGKWIPSTCGMCLHGCGIRVQVVDGVALKIEGDPTVSAYHQVEVAGYGGLDGPYQVVRATHKVNRGEGTLGKLVNDDSLYFTTKDSLKKMGKAADQLQEQGPLSIIGIGLQALGAW